MIIRVTNDLTVGSPVTYMSASKAAAVGTINVKNVSQFTANWAIQIGATGEEKSEVGIISSASGTNIVLNSNTSFDHPTNTPVFAIKYDKAVFKKSTAGTAGTASEITGGTVTITPDSDYTQYDDTSGTSTDAYKVYFKNSITGDVSADSDWLTPTGFTFYSLAKIRERVKSKLGNSDFLKDDEQVDDWINEWLEEMTNSAIDVDKSYSLGTVNIGFGTDGLGTVTSTDFKNFKRIWVTYDGSNKYRATRLDLTDTYPNETYAQTHPYYTWRDYNVFQISPSDSAGTAEIVYSKTMSLLTSDADELPLVMRAYTKSFVNYALAEAYYMDDKEAKGDRYLARANSDKSIFIKEITPRDFTGVQTIDDQFSVYGEDDELMYL